MVTTTISGDSPQTFAINQQTYDIVIASLERKGITPNIARVLAYEILLIANITQQPYNAILSKISSCCFISSKLLTFSFFANSHVVLAISNITSKLVLIFET